MKQRPRNCVRSLFFCILCSISNANLCQISTQDNDRFFKLKKSFTIAVENSLIAIPPHTLTIVTNDLNQVGYFFLGIDHKKREFTFCEIDLITEQNKIHRVTYSKKIKIDKRNIIAKLYLGLKEGILKLHIGDIILDIELKTDRILHAAKVNKKYKNFFFSSDYDIGSYYYNEAYTSDKTGLCVLRNQEEVMAIHPPMDFIEFTHFTPCNMVDVNSDFVLWLSVSKPMVYAYNHQLELLDSLCFDPVDWVDIDVVKNEQKYVDLRKVGIFEFGSTVLQDTASKNLAIQFVNDSTFMVSSMYSTLQTNEVIFTINKLGKIAKKAFRIVDNSSFFDSKIVRNDFELFQESANAMISNNKMFTIYLGPGYMPWEIEPLAKRDFEKYSYLNLIEYNFIAP